MKVTISVFGRFHAFELARELEQRSALRHLHTSYPVNRVTPFGVSAEHVVARPVHELGNRTLQRVPTWSRGHVDPRWLSCYWYDRTVADSLTEGSDIFLGWSGSCLASMRRARELGSTVFVERGSTHIQHQNDVLTEEYSRLGTRGRLPHPRIVDRELREYAEADRIVVPTHFCKQTFVRRGFDPERILQVPYGVSLTSFYPASDVYQGPFSILHCGTVSLRKGCHRLLRTFREARLPGAQLHFVGPVAPEMKPYIERWGGRDTIFHGRVPQTELVHLYHRASVFCLASLEEGMAMVVPQAMASGLPIVATHESGAGEAVRSGKEGLLVNACRDEELGEALRQLHAEPERARAMGAAAARRVQNGFRWEDYGAHVYDAYRAALGALRTSSTKAPRVTSPEASRSSATESFPTASARPSPSSLPRSEVA